jgi:hypothetical protein
MINQVCKLVANQIMEPISATHLHNADSRRGSPEGNRPRSELTLDDCGYAVT